jgi:hypothetical protein
MEVWRSWIIEDFWAISLFCKILQWWLHVLIPLSKPKECITPRMNLNYGLWVIIIYQFRLINCQTQAFDSKRGYGYVIWGSFLLSFAMKNLKLLYKIVCWKRLFRCMLLSFEMFPWKKEIWDKNWGWVEELGEWAGWNWELLQVKAKNVQRHIAKT